MVSRLSGISYGDPPPVAARTEGIRADDSYSLDPVYVPLDENDNRIIPTGTFLAVRQDSVLARPLPCSRTTLYLDGENIIPVEDVTAFAQGDAIYVKAPFTTVSVGAGTWLNGETATITIGGVDVTHTVLGGMTSPIDIANGLSTAVNNHPAASVLVYSIYRSSNVWLFAADYKSSYTVEVSDTSIGGSLTAMDPILLGSHFYGNVTWIDYDNSILNVDNSPAFMIPKETVVCATDWIAVGLIANSLNLSNTADMEYAPFVGGSFQLSNMPYLDSGLEAEFPLMRFI